MENNLKFGISILNIISFAFKIFVLVSVAIPYINNISEFDTTYYLQLCLTIGIGVNLISNLKICIFVFCSNEEDNYNSGKWSQLINMCVFVCICWLGNLMDRGKINGDSYNVSLWLIITNFADAFWLIIICLIMCGVFTFKKENSVYIKNSQTLEDNTQNVDKLDENMFQPEIIV